MSGNGGGYCKIVEGPYAPPVGPKGIMGNESPGLGGTNHGTQNGPDSSPRPSGSPGLGGTNHGNCGTQGRY